MTEPNAPSKSSSAIMPSGYARIIPLWDADRDPVRTLYTRLTTLAPGASAGEDGADRYAWLDKAKLLPGQGWELEIRKAL